MRFSRQTTVDELSVADVPEQGSLQVPSKAQRILGEKARVSHTGVPGRVSHDIKFTDPDAFWNIRDAEEKSLATIRGSVGGDADSEILPGARQGAALPNIPRPIRPSEDLPQSSKESSVPTGTSTTRGHQGSHESMNREYYEAAKQPLKVSQQTSESSVRDMALRKGSQPQLPYNLAMESAVFQWPSKAEIMKKFGSKEKPKSPNDNTKDKKKDLSSLLSQPKIGGRKNSSSKLGRSSSETTGTSAGTPKTPQEPVHSPFTRQGSSRSGDANASKPLPEQPKTSSESRVKFFEPDIYDSKNTTTYRPPKGVKNWFDGIDVSSGDEEEPEPVELPAVEAPAKTGLLAVQEALPSVFSLYGPPSREFTPPNIRNSVDSIQKTPSASRSSQEAMKRRMRTKESESSIAEEPAPAEAVEAIIDRKSTDRRRGGESRLAQSRLGSESVLSLSSASEEGKQIHSAPVEGTNESARGSTVILDQARPMELQRSSVHIRSVPALTDVANLPHEPKMRRSYSADQPSTGISSTLPSGAISPPSSLQRNRSVFSDSSVRRYGSMHDSIGRSASSNLGNRRLHSSHGQEGRKSTSDETSSSVPTDASRMMAVTEEEMMLLELMRQKRAAMQQTSFAEGYRLARSESDSKVVEEKSVTGDPALVILKQKNSSSSKRSAQSKTDSLIRREMEHRRRLSALRKEDVDEAFKMGRFLAMEQPNGQKSRMERFLVMAPGLASEFDGRPISGTEIDIESRYGDNETNMGEEMASRFDEADQRQLETETECEEDETSSSHYEEDEENGQAQVVQATRQSGQVFSPMQRLTNSIVRGHPSEGLQQYSPHTDDHYNKVRDFLTPAGSTGRSALPTPPTEETLEKYPSSQADGQIIEEEPPVPVKSPNRPSAQHYHSRSQEAPETYSPSEQQYDDPETPIARSWARPPSLKHPRPNRQPAVLDFAPLEVPAARVAVSPSIATSRPSPLTPWTDTFEPAPLSSNVSAKSAAPVSDDGNYRNEPYFSESAIPNPLRSHPANSVNAAKTRKGAPPKIDTLSFQSPEGNRVTSMSSITSAGEDVLRAWADLGGNDNIAFKRKLNR